MDRSLDFFFNFPHWFSFILDNMEIIVNKKRKLGVTDRPRLLNPSKAMPFAQSLFIFISTNLVRSIHEVACESETIGANILLS